MLYKISIFGLREREGVSESGASVNSYARNMWMYGLLRESAWDCNCGTTRVLFGSAFLFIIKCLDGLKYNSPFRELYS